MSNKKAQGFRFSCLFSPFSLTNQDTFTLENILKKYIFLLKNMSLELEQLFFHDAHLQGIMERCVF